MRAQGLGIEQVYRNGLGITVRGTVRAVERAFGTQLATYRLGASTFFANGGPVRVPQSLAPLISAVSGLDNAATPRPLAAHSTGGGSRAGASHLTAGGQFAGYSPGEVAQMYDVQPIYDKGWTGANQVIALAEFGDYSDDDIATYDSQFGLTTLTRRVLVNDGTQTGEKLNKNQTEVELDIEVAHALAPGARVDVYVTPNRSGDWLPMLELMASNNPQIVSSSYGAPETFRDPALVWAMDALFREMAAQGITVFAAAGDQGAYDASTQQGATAAQKSQLVVDHPGSDPWVTAVGGTELQQNADGSYGGESSWGNPQDPQGPSGGGGGLSMYFTRPDYQSGPGVTNQFTNGSRQVPDVSADADPRTGYAIYSVDDSGNAGWLVFGGTSAATPLWAGFAALLDQYGNGRIGFFNPSLYALGQRAATLQFSPFHDVTNGTNLFYSATPGWDFATGWGSFDASALLVDLQQIGVVTYAFPSVDIRMFTGVARVVKGKLRAVRTVTRGQRAYLYIDVVTEAVPNNTPAAWRFTMTPNGKSGGYQWLKHNTFTSKDVGKEKVLTWKITVPAHARRGAYRLVAALALAGTTQQASAAVTVK